MIYIWFVSWTPSWIKPEGRSLKMAFISTSGWDPDDPEGRVSGGERQVFFRGEASQSTNPDAFVFQMQTRVLLTCTPRDCALIHFWILSI